MEETEMTMENLSRIVQEYKTAGTPAAQEKAVQALGEYIYTHLPRYRITLHDEDTRSDFVVWLYPNFMRILKHFNPVKAGLATYLNWVIRLSFKTFCREQYSNAARQQVYVMEEQTRIISEMAEQENCMEWTGNISDIDENYHRAGPLIAELSGASVKKRNMIIRRLILLACKSGNALDDRLVTAIVTATGISEEYLRRRLDCVRQRWILSMDRMRLLREKRYSYYLRAQKNLLEMKNLDSTSARYVLLEKEYRYCCRRVDEIRKKEEHLQSAPSNRFLAGVLGLCRGTVDSTLASVRNHEYCEVS